jgi:outer membrane protein assembly factor BamB
MKKSITSNFRPLLRALYVSLVVIAVLWTMPRNARAQLYVGKATGFGGWVVGKYSAKTGHVINANFITGLSNPPLALAVEDNTLFVSDHDSIGKYDATTGAVIKKDFFTGLRIIIAFVLILPKHDTGYSLAQNGVIWEVVDGVGLADFITGLDQPSGLAVFGSAEKAVLFVTDRDEEGRGTVGAYDANTGFTINRHFITGLSGPSGLAVTGNTLFVANTSSGTVGKYDATTGGAVNAGFVTGLEKPNGLAVRENTLFVTSANRGTVGAYDATTGAAINRHFITGLAQAAGIAVKSAK